MSKDFSNFVDGNRMFNSDMFVFTSWSSLSFGWVGRIVRGLERTSIVLRTSMKFFSFVTFILTGRESFIMEFRYYYLYGVLRESLWYVGKKHGKSVFINWDRRDPGRPLEKRYVWRTLYWERRFVFLFFIIRKTFVWRSHR